MNSKGMSKWSGVFLLLGMVTIIFDLLATASYDGGVYFCLVISTVFNVGSSIIKKLESFEATK